MRYNDTGTLAGLGTLILLVKIISKIAQVDMENSF